ncbi:MAG: YqaA family protein [Gemmatimonadota bacterium]
MSPAERSETRSSALRRLYDWVLSWADTRYGPLALFGLAFAESSFFPIPPDPLLIALALGAPRRGIYFAALATAGSVLGGVVGYAIGWGVWAVVQDFFFAYVPGVSPEAFAQVGSLYDRWDFVAIFAAGFTPIPYKVFTLSAGVFGISFGIFIVASTLSRGLRFLLLGGLVYFFGPGIQSFIDRYFDRLAWLFLILLVGGFAVLKFVL